MGTKTIDSIETIDNIDAMDRTGGVVEAMENESFFLLGDKMAQEKLKPRVGVGVAVISDQKLLLGRRKGAHGSGDWSFPGGHLEFGEDVAECAKRELREETGLHALSLHMGPWVSDIFDGDKHYITLFVFVDLFEGELQLMEPHKCEGWHWFELNALPSPLFRPIPSLIERIKFEDLTWMQDAEAFCKSFRMNTMVIKRVREKDLLQQIGT